MSYQIPIGWIETTLGEIAKPSRERALPFEFPNLRYIGLEHIEAQSMKLIEQGEVREARSASIRFSTNDVLYGKMRPYLNKVWVAQFEGLCSAEFLVFRRSEKINSKFLAMRLNSEDFVTFADEQASGERPRVGFEKLSRFPILLPPLAEQERIVAKLDNAVSGTARAEAAARRAQERLKAYRAAVLRAGVTGELTRAWRETKKKTQESDDDTAKALLGHLIAARRAGWEETELKRLNSVGKKPKGDGWKSRYREPAFLSPTFEIDTPITWIWARLQQIGFVNGGLTKNPTRMALRFKLPYLRVANVYANELRLENVRTIGVAKDEIDKLLLEKGDLLVVEGNGSKDQIGRVAIWDGSIEQCVHQNHIIRVRLADKHLGAWILTWLLSPVGRKHIERVASSTTGLYTLSISKVEDLPIPIPPANERAKIMSRVDQRLLAADQLAIALERQLIRAKRTRQLLSLEAFSGQLVPQDPTDEPASFLLDRIRESGKSETEKAKPIHMSKFESKFNRKSLLAVLREHKHSMTPEQLFRLSGYQQEFKDKDCRQEVVDRFYEELRQLVGPMGSVREIRPDANSVLLEAKS
jgi:type I restriction enzyme S subunit